MTRAPGAGRPPRGRNKLSRYMVERGFTSASFAKTLLDRGQVPHAVTVRNWMAGGPISERWRAVIEAKHRGALPK